MLHHVHRDHGAELVGRKIAQVLQAVAEVDRAAVALRLGDHPGVGVDALRTDAALVEHRHQLAASAAEVEHRLVLFEQWRVALGEGGEHGLAVAAEAALEPDVVEPARRFQRARRCRGVGLARRRCWARAALLGAAWARTRRSSALTCSRSSA